MTESLRALLTGIIDYAGMFPPASLPLDQAIRNYARYRTEAESWMLGKFICPAGKLEELSGHVPKLFASGPPLRLSILLGGGKSSAEFLANVRRELKLAEEFCQRHRQEAVIESFEARLPADFGEWSTPELADQFVKGQLALGLADSECFLELPNQGPFRLVPGGEKEAMLLQLGSVGYPIDSEDTPQRFKFRSGGTEASAFPSVERTAEVLATCCTISAPLKFTAGLHHPVRRLDPGLNVKMHGFINVFVAGVLAQVRNLNEEQIRRILEEEDPATFRFDSERLRWKDPSASMILFRFWDQRLTGKDLSATVDEITAARRYVTSFGSCSFDEPRDDLRQLGWL